MHTDEERMRDGEVIRDLVAIADLMSDFVRWLPLVGMSGSSQTCAFAWVDNNRQGDCVGEG